MPWDGARAARDPDAKPITCRADTRTPVATGSSTSAVTVSLIPARSAAPMIASYMAGLCSRRNSRQG